MLQAAGFPLGRPVPWEQRRASATWPCSAQQRGRSLLAQQPGGKRQKVCRWAPGSACVALLQHAPSFDQLARQQPALQQQPTFWLHAGWQLVVQASSAALMASGIFVLGYQASMPTG